MARYEIAFSAQLVPGAQLELVKANLAKLFQADEQRLALLPLHHHQPLGLGQRR